MATSLVDSPPAPPEEHQPPEGPPGSAAAPASPSAPPSTPAQPACVNCGAPMADGQDWCLQCGAAGAGSLASPSWRAGAMVLLAATILALGAAAAGYAALSKGPRKVVVVRSALAQATPPAAVTPTTTAPPPVTTPGALATSPKAKALLPLGQTKPPKIPLSAATPTASETTTTPKGSETKTPTSTSTTPVSPTGGSGATPKESESTPKAILLDTDAASTYNPYELPAGEFGDPSLAIDGDTATGWSAEVDPANAPSMVVGLLIDLKAKQKLSALELITSTPGMTVQVYGTTGHAAPTSITDPAWVALSPSKVVKKRHLRLSLRDSKKAFTFVTLWISKAPQSSVGTPEAPGRLSVNEIELFPAS